MFETNTYQYIIIGLIIIIIILIIFYNTRPKYTEKMTQIPTGYDPNEGKYKLINGSDEGKYKLIDVDTSSEKPKKKKSKKIVKDPGVFDKEYTMGKDYPEPMNDRPDLGQCQPCICPNVETSDSE